MLNSLFNILEQFCQFIVCKIDSLFMLMIIHLKAISIGRKSNFYGCMKFKRGSKGTIYIGNNCTFRSKHTSNLIGINRPCIFSSIGMNGSRLIVGNDCGFSGTVIGCFSEIIIGKNCNFGGNTFIWDTDFHSLDYMARRINDYSKVKNASVYIGNDVFVGANSIILKGVTIGENTVIGANSLVVKNIPSNVIAAGNPCKVLKNIDNVFPYKNQ